MPLLEPSVPGVTYPSLDIPDVSRGIGGQASTVAAGQRRQPTGRTLPCGRPGGSRSRAPSVTNANPSFQEATGRVTARLPPARRRSRGSEYAKAERSEETREKTDRRSLTGDGILVRCLAIHTVTDVHTCSTGTSATPARRRG